MKTLCVAVVVLSLTSVCQPAPLACEKLLKPMDKAPNMLGRWYYIAVSSEICLASTILNSVFWPSIAVDVTAKDTPNIYDGNFKIKIYGYCRNESEAFLQENNTLVGVDSNNAPTDEPDLLLQSGCPDCIVVKADGVINSLMLFSRRKTVTAAELKEFETQAECIGWSKPQVFNSEHGYDNCKDPESDISDANTQEIFSKMLERVNITRQDIIKCITEFFLSYFPTFF